MFVGIGKGLWSGFNNYDACLNVGGVSVSCIVSIISALLSKISSVPNLCIFTGITTLACGIFGIKSVFISLWNGILEKPIPEAFIPLFDTNFDSSHDPDDVDERMSFQGDCAYHSLRRIAGTWFLSSLLLTLDVALKDRSTLFYELGMSSGAL